MCLGVSPHPGTLTLMAKHTVQYLDISPLTRLRLARSRLSARLFCWLADHAPYLAEVWAFRTLKR